MTPLYILAVGAAFLAVSSTAYGSELKFEGNLSGAQEVVFVGGSFVPGGTDTEGEGRVKARFDKGLTEVRVDLRADDLEGTFAAAHFRCGRPGQNGPIPFGLVNPGPLQFDGKRIRGTLTNTDFNGADCVPVIGRPVNNIASLAFAMRDGLIYANFHTTVFPGGELRAQMLED